MLVMISHRCLWWRPSFSLCVGLWSVLLLVVFSSTAHAFTHFNTVKTIAIKEDHSYINEIKAMNNNNNNNGFHHHHHHHHLWKNRKSAWLLTSTMNDNNNNNNNENSKNSARNYYNDFEDIWPNDDDDDNNSFDWKNEKYIDDDDDDEQQQQMTEGEKKEDGWDNWFSDLRARQEELQQQQTTEQTNENNSDEVDETVRSNWMDATCTSTIRLALSDDWIRRVAMDTYPLAIVGGCTGSLYLADLDQGLVLDCVEALHADYEPPPLSATTNNNNDNLDPIQALYGEYDGGGIISLAMRKDWVYSSGREGGLHISRLESSDDTDDNDEGLNLVPYGYLPHIQQDTVITAVAMDSQRVWAAGFDGVLYGMEHPSNDSDPDDLLLHDPEEQDEAEVVQINVGAPITQVHICEALGCGVCATTNGKVILFSLKDHSILDEWGVFPSSSYSSIFRNSGSKNRQFARSVTIVPTNIIMDDQEQQHWSVVVGGSRGQLYQRPLSQSSTLKFTDDIQRLRPSHAGSVVSMTSPASGLLITGAQDGTIRVWDCSPHNNHDQTATNNDHDDEDDDDDDDDDDSSFWKDDATLSSSRPACMYALTGYKVWLGSILTDGKRLISDGADNTIVVHDFSGEDDLHNDDNNDDDVTIEEDDYDDDFSMDD